MPAHTPSSNAPGTTPGITPGAASGAAPTPRKRQPNGADLVIRLLERQGVDVVAGIPGGANLPLYDALGRADSIRHVLARHEQGAGFMAQGMARVTGRPAVFFATSGPGATNTLTAIADAKLDSVPVVCVTGQVPLGLVGSDAFQEVDIYGMSIPVTKHNFLVRSVDELAEVIPAAFRIAASGRPGPVLVDIPKNVQMAPVDQAVFDNPPQPGQPAAPPAPDPAAISRAAALLNAARRPMLYLGGGVVASGASDMAVQLAERAGLPTVMTLMALGAMPAGHPLSLGMLGMHAARHTNLLLAECDVLLVAGARFDDRAVGKAERFCPQATIVHIDIDESELDKILPVHCGITGDVGLALAELLPLLRHRAETGREAWLTRVEECRRRHPFVMPGADDPRTPYGLIRCAADAVDHDAIVATDVGQHQMRTAQAYPLRGPRRWLTSGGLGTMGFGLPAAIGAALARPEATVLCFTGDGSLQMNIQELATAAEEGVNVKILLADNNALGLVRQQQELFYEGRLVASAYRRKVDFARIAEGFGVPAVDLDASEHPLRDLADALRAPGPCLIRVTVPAEANVYPMVPPGADNLQMIGGEPETDAAMQEDDNDCDAHVDATGGRHAHA